MGAAVYRDDEGLLRCRRSPGGTEWYVTQPEVGTFQLTERPPPSAAGKGKGKKASAEPQEAPQRLSVGRIDPETAEAIIKFLLRERG